MQTKIQSSTEQKEMSYIKIEEDERVFYFREYDQGQRTSIYALRVKETQDGHLDFFFVENFAEVPIEKILKFETKDDVDRNVRADLVEHDDKHGLEFKKEGEKTDFKTVRHCRVIKDKDEKLALVRKTVGFHLCNEDWITIDAETGLEKEEFGLVNLERLYFGGAKYGGPVTRGSELVRLDKEVHPVVYSLLVALSKKF